MRSVKILTITGNELSSAATRCGACADERSSLIPFFGVIDALTHLWLRKFFNRERSSFTMARLREGGGGGMRYRRECWLVLGYNDYKCELARCGERERVAG